MPRFFFDITNNGEAARDDIGIDLVDAEAARKHVGTLLPDLAHQDLPDGDEHTFACSARDEVGSEVYRAELIYRGTRTAAKRP